MTKYRIFILLIFLNFCESVRSQSKLLSLKKLSEYPEYMYCIGSDTNCKSGYYYPKTDEISNKFIDTSKVLKLSIAGFYYDSIKVKQALLKFNNAQQLRISYDNYYLKYLNSLSNLQWLVLPNYNLTNMFDNPLLELRPLKKLKCIEMDSNDGDFPFRQTIIPEQLIKECPSINYKIDASYIPVSLPLGKTNFKSAVFDQVYPEIAYLFANDQENDWAENLIKKADLQIEVGYEFKLSKNCKFNSELPFWYPGNKLMKKPSRIEIRKDSMLYEIKYSNGNKIVNGVFKNAVPDGLWKFWYANGELCEERNYKNGVEDGDWIFCNEEGDTTKVFIFDNGKPMGYFGIASTDRFSLRVDSHGSRRLVLYFRNNQKENKYQDIIVLYYDGSKGEGQKVSIIKNNNSANLKDNYLVEVINYKNFKKDGNTIVYNSFQEIKKEILYADGKFISEKIY